MNDIGRTFKLARVEHEADGSGFRVTTLRLNDMNGNPDAMLSLMGRPWLSDLPVGAYVTISVVVSMEPPAPLARAPQSHVPPSNVPPIHTTQGVIGKPRG